MSRIVRIYNAEPTPARFHASNVRVRGIMGPLGSGKSVACAQEIFSRATRQAPNPQKIRRSRWAIIRQTYPELCSTTIKTWQEWFPHHICPLVYGAPITGHIRLPLGDGTLMDLELLFLAMNLPKDVKKVLSLELTGAWVNEAREVEKTIIDALDGRLGRYPPKGDGAPFTWTGMIMDTNPPDETHWWYELAEERDPTTLHNWRFFRQPPALLAIAPDKYKLNPYAENVNGQPMGGDYWLAQTSGKTREWIKVYLMGQYGTILDGKPIYAEQWSDSAHVAECSPLGGVELIAGWDWGLTPACVIAQVTPSGCLEVLDEIVADNLGVEQFVENNVLPHLAQHYPGKSIVHVGDPAGAQRAQQDERTVFEAVRRLGIKIRPAPTQNPTERWEAVRWFLGRMINGRSAFRLSPRCKILRKGFNGGYRFRLMQTPGETRYDEKAEKNRFSHAHDALQYLCCHLRQPYRIPAASSKPVSKYCPREAVGGY